MKASFTIPEALMAELQAAIFSKEGHEGAAYLMCGASATFGEVRLLGRSVVPVADADYLVREPYRLSIDSGSYARAAKAARELGAALVFVHSHPEGIAEFSPQDDREEPALMRFFGQRVPGKTHGSLVISGPASARGRVWTGEGWLPASCVRVLGQRFRFLMAKAGAPQLWFDRQVQAFGPEMQALIGDLHVGIVGCGGTGSAVAEQLCRLGIGTLSLFDGDVLEGTNVTRVYGARMDEVSRNKAACLGEHLGRIGLGTQIRVFDRHILEEAVARNLRECDVVFGCTDVESPRALLVNLALHYLIPVFDIGVKISSREGVIEDITGRVTTLIPGAACLLCRGRITPERIHFEQLSPEAKAARQRDGYAPELETRDPAVVSFTTAIAAQAVNELLHRLTGFMGTERAATEVLVRFHAGHVGKNSMPPSARCLCADSRQWGRGDSREFLGVTWTA